MKRLLLLLVLAACSHESSSGDAPATTASATAAPVAPSASVTAAPSASAAPLPKGKAPAPSALSFCKASLAAEPLSALCATGQDWSKAHFECAKPLPRNFCADLSVWGCQYIASNGEKTPRVSFDARFVRGGVALTPGEMIDDNTLRARFPRAGVTRGVSVKTIVKDAAEGAKTVAAQTKKLTDAGCVVDKPGSGHLDCGSWQATVQYVDASTTVTVDSDMPTTPNCSNPP